ncbi:MAG: efflux RND transporter periplasmic adaptor subunit [Gammaproteobacteria bacterium]|nr:efflux RND transporter periplasmic adaptor subunit [Gammaproteobacteria bacterium]
MISKKSMQRLLLAAIAIAGIAAVVGYTMRDTPLRVVAVAVERGDVEATVANTRAGTVNACRRAGLSPALGGQIASLPVSTGDRVTSGQVLLELWNEDLRAERILAERDAIASAARAKESCVIAKVAEREAKRLVSLRERGISSEEETDRAVGDAEAKQAGCEAVRDLVRVSDARVDVATAALQRTLLKAPFDGVIAEINGELGEFVTPSPVGVPTPPTVDLIDNSCLYISAPIDEVDAPAVRTGMLARITLDAFPDQDFPGHVRRVAPYVLEVEKQARTVEVEAEIDNPEKYDLLPGYSADVEIILDTRVDVLRIPALAVIDGEKVLLLNEQDQVIEERMIERGVSNWEYTEIVSGLDGSELVILSVDREGVEAGATAVRD